MVRPLAPETAVGIVGAGTMGAGIAQVALQAGHPVILVDRDPAIVDRARAGIEARLRRLVDKGRLAGNAADDALARLRSGATAADLAGCALVVEAVIEDLDAKRALFAEVERHVTDDAILASNTSSIPITAIAAGLRRPERFLGMHFFNPAPVMKLVEVISGLLTGADVAETVVATAVAWGKVAARARSTPGFIVNRVARPFYGEALRLLAEGAADAATIDAILRDCGGFRMGPFELTDLIGQDVNAAVTRSVHDAMFQDPRYRPSLLQEEMVEAGRLGRKSGIGFFDYREGAVPAVAAEESSARMPDSIVVEGDPGNKFYLIARGSVAVTRNEEGMERRLAVLEDGDYFGDPVFEYSLAQGIEDGFLAPYRVRRIVLSPDAHGFAPNQGQLDLFGKEIPEGLYTTPDFERVVSLLTRTEAAAKHLTEYLHRTDRWAKTIVFCVDQEHADQMRRALHNANADLAKQHPNYVVRIVSDEGEIGKGHLSDFADTDKDVPVIATTSEMLSTGVDLPTVRNIVLFRPVGSMAAR